MAGSHLACARASRSTSPALLELLWSKRRILEVYVNVVEWGDGVYGVEAAAQRGFGVPAAQLLGAAGGACWR